MTRVDAKLIAAGMRRLIAIIWRAMRQLTHIAVSINIALSKRSTETMSRVAAALPDRERPSYASVCVRCESVINELLAARISHGSTPIHPPAP